jgi:hypothetical protein
MTIFEKRGVAQKLADSLKSDPELYSTVETVLEKCEMNTNSLKNLIRYLKEIRLRDNCGYEDVLKSIKFKELAENTELSERSIGEEISTRFYNLRFPLWSAKQAEFKKLANRFRALTGGEITFPEFAEGNSFRISFEIKKAEDVEKIFETISKGKDILSESLKKIKY